MPLYEVFLKPGKGSGEIEADSAEDARRIFTEMIRDNLCDEDVIANNLETDDGEDKE